MRFGSTAKVLLKCKLKYYRISEWEVNTAEIQGTADYHAESSRAGIMM